MQLDFSCEPTGEARPVGGREAESSTTTNGSESPARTDRLMEEVCERGNLKHALQQVKANKGSAGVDGIKTVGGIEELASYMRGWRGYFGFCETPVELEYLTRWVRLRLRAALWRQWKTPRRRRAALLALGVRSRLASHTAGSGRGPLVPRKGQGPFCGAFQCILQIAGTSDVDRWLLA
jgi:hypothetical protein